LVTEARAAAGERLGVDPVPLAASTHVQPCVPAGAETGVLAPEVEEVCPDVAPPSKPPNKEEGDAGDASVPEDVPIGAAAAT